jgi:hypothetical protein
MTGGNTPEGFGPHIKHEREYESSGQLHNTYY